MTTETNALNDLAWCLESPSLLKDQFQDFQVVQQLDAETFQACYPSAGLARALEAHLAQSKSHFLGPYFEQLWLFYLNQNPNYQVIAHNLQVNARGKTIGEFDALFFDEITRQFYHQELAIKYYLGHPSHSKPLWIGPQTVDRLDKKLDRLMTHQLILSTHPAAKARLRALGIKQVQPQLVMRGYLFQPGHLPPLPLPNYVNTDCLQGEWLPVSEFRHRIQHHEYQGSAWRALSKKQWLTPLCCSEQDDRLVDPLDALSESNRPILFSRLEREAHCMIEVEKLFIVADEWPHLSETPPAL